MGPNKTNSRPLRSEECSRRTGLTARALRVYEKQKLITPLRDANGWRLFRDQDLARLNSIAVLKFLGLSLAQVREALATGGPTLEETLRNQKRVWTAHRDRADQALKSVDGALHILAKRHALDVDLLCDLVSRFEMPFPEPEVKVLAARRMTAKETDEWASWWAKHPDDLSQSSLYLNAQRELLKRLEAKMRSGSAPSDPGIGRLMIKLESLLLEYGVRERACRQLDWNRPLTTKWYRLGQRESLDTAKLKKADRGLYSRQLADYLESAYWHSPIGKALNDHLLSAKRLTAAKAPFTSKRAKSLALDFAATCRIWNLGNPATHARFAAFIETLNRTTNSGAWRLQAWRYLCRAQAGH